MWIPGLAHCCQDAPIVNTQSSTSVLIISGSVCGDNIPIGTGLDVRVGELISLLNYESGDAAREQQLLAGLQCFSPQPPAAGVQLATRSNDWIGVKGRVQTPVPGPIDNNSSKNLSGESTSAQRQALGQPHWFGAGKTPALPIALGRFAAGRLATTTELSFGTELDYFSFHNPSSSTPLVTQSVLSRPLDRYDFSKQLAGPAHGVHQ